MLSRYTGDVITLAMLFGICYPSIPKIAPNSFLIGPKFLRNLHPPQPTVGIDLISIPPNAVNLASV